MSLAYFDGSSPRDGVINTPRLLGDSNSHAVFAVRLSGAGGARGEKLQCTNTDKSALRIMEELLACNDEVCERSLLGYFLSHFQSPQAKHAIFCSPCLLRVGVAC